VAQLICLQEKWLNKWHIKRSLELQKLFEIWEGVIYCNNCCTLKYRLKETYSYLQFGRMSKLRGACFKDIWTAGNWNLRQKQQPSYNEPRLYRTNLASLELFVITEFDCIKKWKIQTSKSKLVEEPHSPRERADSMVV